MMDTSLQVGTVAPVHPLNELLASFTQWQRQRSCSAATMRRRRSSLTNFARWMAPAHIATASTTDVEEWLDTFTAPRTRHAYRSDLATFYRWATRRQILAHDPIILTDPIRVPKSLPRPVSAHLVADIIATAPDDTVRLACALAAYAGLRRSEIAALTADDIATHISPPLLAVRNGKGGKDRLVPLHPALAPMLAGIRHGRIVDATPDTIGRRVAEHLRACGLDASLHQLRHTFGTELVRVTNGNLILGGLLMGHESPDTTKGYVGWNGGDAAAAVGAMFVAA